MLRIIVRGGPPGRLRGASAVGDRSIAIIWGSPTVRRDELTFRARSTLRWVRLEVAKPRPNPTIFAGRMFPAQGLSSHFLSGVSLVVTSRSLGVWLVGSSSILLVFPLLFLVNLFFLLHTANKPGSGITAAV